MTELGEESPTESTINSVADNVENPTNSVFDNVEDTTNSVFDNFEDLTAAYEFHAKQRGRLFGREKSVHGLLGGGHSADVLLWREKSLSARFLTGVTVIWTLFELAGCHLVSLLSLLSLGIMVTMFFWANAADFLHRSPPPVPRVQLTDEFVSTVASTLQVEINRTLATLHDIALGSDVKAFLKVALGFWVLSILGGWFHFLTLIFLAIVAAHTFPFIYEKHEEVIDEYAQKALDELYKHYKRVDAAFLSKIPRGPTKEKKTE